MLLFFLCALFDPDTNERENRRENNGREWFMFLKDFFTGI
jgi:hypothetical protein